MPGVYLQPTLAMATLATLARRLVYLWKLGVKTLEDFSIRRFCPTAAGPGITQAATTPTGDYQHLTKDEMSIHPQRHPRRALVHIQYQTPGVLRHTR